MYTKEERGFIRDFCSRIGKIEFPVCNTKVDQTAHGELLRFLGGYPLTGSGVLIVGRVDNSAFIRELSDSQTISIADISAEDDGFEIKQVGNNIIVAGANPRGVLYGIYELEERILAGNAENLNVKVIPAFRKRSDALGHYHNARTYNFGNDVIDDRKAEYLARLRINQFCACFDCSDFGNHLSDFVHSDVFPFMRQPSPEAVSKLRDTAATLSKYGIDYIMMTWEPTIPSLFAPVEAYPVEALGTVHRPWGGDENHMDRTLCINSPLVQDHYRNIIGKFIRQFPDVKGLFLYNMDGGSWLCTPELCPRCREALVDSDPTAFNPWENQAKLVTLISEAAHEANPDFTINFWGDVHFHGEPVQKMLETAEGYDYLTTSCMGSDHDIFVTNTEHPCFEVEVTRNIAAARERSAYMYYAYNRLESVQPGLPSPFATVEALQTFHHWGIRNLLEVTGPTPAMNQITALTMRQFQSEPDTDARSWLTELARRQFGADAGPYMYTAWEEIHKAFACWRNVNANPLTGSNFMIRLGLFSNVSGAPSILPEILDQFEAFYYETLSNVEPWRRGAYEEILTSEYLERFCEMEAHLAVAEERAQTAAEKAGSDPVCICYYAGDFEGISRHTQFEYARLNLCSIQMTHSMCRQVIHMLRAVVILRNMRDKPLCKEELLPEYWQLLYEDRVVLEDYASMLKSFLQMRPCLSMTGMCENEIEIYLEDAKKRIAQIDQYLINQKDGF